MTICKIILFAISAFAAGLAISSPAGASAWNYGCRGALPVFNESTVIIFNRERLVLLPRSWLKGTFRALGPSAATDQVIEVMEAADMNSGLAATMVFSRPDHPDKKITLTEISSKTTSDAKRRAGISPRDIYTTTYKKVYRYVSDVGYMGPFEITMNCIDYQLSAPIHDGR
jgi:hypothetical protein